MKYNFTQMFVSLKVECRQSSYLLIVFLQRRASDQWQGFEDKNLGSSPSLLGQQVATVAAHQPGGTPQIIVDKTSRMTGRLRVYFPKMYLHMH